jgi:hypothetical protein
MKFFTRLRDKKLSQEIADDAETLSKNIDAGKDALVKIGQSLAAIGLIAATFGGTAWQALKHWGQVIGTMLERSGVDSLERSDTEKVFRVKGQEDLEK